MNSAINKSELIPIIIYVISSLSLFLYLLVFIILCKRGGVFITMLISFQLLITCFLYSAAYFLPNGNGDMMCRIQATFKTFGELSKLSIATIILFLSQLNFVNSDEIEKKKVFYLIISGILSWIVPITIGIVCVVCGRAITYSYFCFIETKEIVFTFVPIRYLLILMFFLLFWRLNRVLNKTYQDISIDENYTRFLYHIKKYAILMGVNTCIVLVYLILDIIKPEGQISYENYPQLTICYGITDILDSMTSPGFVVVFLLDKRKMRTLKNALLCRDDPDNFELLDEEGEKIRKMTAVQD